MAVNQSQGFATRVAPPAVHPPAAAVRQMSPAVMNHVLVPRWIPPHPQQNMPVGNTQSRSLFQDESNSGIRWYLPAFVLADAPDPSFQFAASQSGHDQSGKPYNTGLLKLTLKKVLPADVVSFKAAQPTIQLKEIPLPAISVTLFTSYKDSDSGQTKQNPYPGKAVLTGDSLQLTFDNIPGTGVVVLYENLISDGGAQVSLSAACDVVFRQLQPAPAPQPSPAPQPPHAARPQFAAPNNMVAFRLAMAPAANTAFHPAQPQPGATYNYVPGKLPYSQNLPLETQFAADAYQLKFTVTTQSGTRPILGVQDLQSFNVPQSEFSEVKALGDISQRYPTLSRLFMGVLSKTIVVIPARYGIVRSSAGCLSMCQALLDSASSAASRCKFQFTFVLAPEVSPIELLQLSQEVANHPEFKGYTVKLPDFLQDHPPATLSSPFQSAFTYSPGLQPHTFRLAVEIRDQDLDSPAVANANLFIKALATPHEPYLTGTLFVKLDDGYQSPVQANVVLNFAETSSTDELAFNIDEGAQTIQLINHSPLDLQISRYALCCQQVVNVLPLQQVISSGQSATVPLPSNHAGLSVAIEDQLSLPSTMSKDEVMKYLSFQVEDVQSTQFSLAVNATGVSYDGRAVDRIDVQVTFATLPQLTPAPFSLNKLHTADGTQLLVPIQNAITKLDGSTLFTIHYTDTTKDDLKFTVQNDFCDHPVLVLNDSDIPSS